MFGREGRPTRLGQAFAEDGRIAKTEHLLRVVDPVDDTCRRQMNRQLTVQESRHKLWTTRYIDAAVARPQAEGHELREEDIARLSPLKHRNLNLLGRYSFTASTPSRRRPAPTARPGRARAGRGRRRERAEPGPFGLDQVAPTCGAL